MFEMCVMSTSVRTISVQCWWVKVWPLYCRTGHPTFCTEILLKPQRCRMRPVPLTYNNIIGEMRRGLSDYLYVKCQNPACGEIGIETVHRQDSSPTRIMKTVHRQKWRQFTDRIKDSSSTNFILYLYGMSQFSPFIDVIINEGLIQS